VFGIAEPISAKIYVNTVGAILSFLVIFSYRTWAEWWIYFLKRMMSPKEFSHISQFC